MLVIGVGLVWLWFVVMCEVWSFGEFVMNDMLYVESYVVYGLGMG